MKKIILHIKEAKKHLTEIDIKNFVSSVLPNWERVKKEFLGATEIKKDNQILKFESPEHLFKYLLTYYYENFPKDIKEMWLKYIKSPKHAGEDKDTLIKGFLQVNPRLREVLSWSSENKEIITHKQYGDAEAKASAEGKHTSRQDIYKHIGK